MADIAILVVEEYERMLKLTAEKGSLTAETRRWRNIPTENMIFGIKEKKIENLKRKFQAKSQFGAAVSNGFFSA